MSQGKWHQYGYGRQGVWRLLFEATPLSWAAWWVTNSVRRVSRSRVEQFEVHPSTTRLGSKLRATPLPPNPSRRFFLITPRQRLTKKPSRKSLGSKITFLSWRWTSKWASWRMHSPCLKTPPAKWLKGCHKCPPNCPQTHTSKWARRRRRRRKARRPSDRQRNL